MIDFEYLAQEILGLTNEEMEDRQIIEQAFYEKFDITLAQGFTFAQALLPHTPTVEATITGTTYHAFVSRKNPVMLMKIEVSK